jgi:hypothetical protein
MVTDVSEHAPFHVRSAAVTVVRSGITKYGVRTSVHFTQRGCHYRGGLPFSGSWSVWSSVHRLTKLPPWGACLSVTKMSASPCERAGGGLTAYPAEWSGELASRCDKHRSVCLSRGTTDWWRNTSFASKPQGVAVLPLPSSWAVWQQCCVCYPPV